MEKQAKPKNKILQYLPKAASAVNFQNPPFSPRHDKRSDNAHRHKAHVGKGFSGPIIRLIPDGARTKPKNGSFETQEEPTSPKISCMGQIKHKNKMKKAKAKHASRPQETSPAVSSSREVKKHAFTIKRLFSSSKQSGRRSDASNDDKPPIPDRAPTLCQMKRFASGRDTLASFDWTAQITPLEFNQRDYYSDEERRDSDQEDEEVIIPFSAPIMIGSGVASQPRKEINLWKRRTMNPPRPLQLNSTVTTN